MVIFYNTEDARKHFDDEFREMKGHDPACNHPGEHEGPSQMDNMGDRGIPQARKDMTPSNKSEGIPPAEMVHGNVKGGL